jgi:hypothetical protein
MQGNSPKGGETRNPQVFAVRLALEWIEQNGGQQRIPMALLHLLEATWVAIERGDPPPEKDSQTLADLWRLQKGGDSAVPVAPLRAGEMGRWWSSRKTHLAQFSRDRGSELVPSLVIHAGGGRHHMTRFSIAFEEAVPFAPDDTSIERSLPDPPTVAPHSVGAVAITYRIDPAKPALWMRLLVGSQPFRINSWRGYVLLGSAVLNMTLIGALGLLVYLDWSRPRSVSTADLVHLALVVALSIGLWALSRPVRELPSRRVTLAGVSYLAISQLHGQLRAMHDSDRKVGGRVFSVVRHWGICPVCSADVDLDEGGSAYPDRLVGRCHDSPSEHVFSFDPVTLSGSIVTGAPR